MANANFIPVNGVISDIEPTPEMCCETLVTIQTEDGIEQFIIAPDTYVINGIRLRPGMQVAAFYDGNAPALLLYPPRHQAVVIGQRRPRETIVIDYFDENLVGTDNSLKINPDFTTEIVTSNGQKYSCEISNQYLIVYYSITTRSIPPQTTPRKIIVIC